MVMKTMSLVSVLVAMMAASGCSHTMNSEFSCNSPAKTNCEPLHHVDARMSIQGGLAAPFSTGAEYWDLDSAHHSNN